MAVCVANQIVHNVHHVIVLCIKAQDKALNVFLLIRQHDFKRVHPCNAVISRSKVLADRYALAIKDGFFIQNLIDVEASANPACKQLAVNGFIAAIFEQFKSVSRSSPRLRIAAICGQVARKILVLHRVLLAAKRDINKRFIQMVIVEINVGKRS